VSFNMAGSITSPRGYTRVVWDVVNDVGSDREPLLQISIDNYDDVTGLFFVFRCTAKLRAKGRCGVVGSSSSTAVVHSASYPPGRGNRVAAYQ